MRKSLFPSSLFLLSALLLVSSSTGTLAIQGTPQTPVRHIAPAQERDWSDVETWTYQLQGYTGSSLDEIGSSHFDLAVVDYSADGSESTEWAAADVQSARTGPNGPRRMIAYLSIGEAEDYRFYWEPWWQVGDPDFIVSENPQWPGNYKVKYWDTEWQAILFGSPSAYLDRILAQDFDGIYLDLVDSYLENYARQELGGLAASRQAMVDLVLALADYARAAKGDDFAIFPQNAEEIAEDHPEYVAGVNGIGKEETYFEATNQRTSNNDRFWTEENLDRYLTAGPWGFGLVLEVDYANQNSKIDETYDICMNYKDYIPYCTRVDLDRMTVNDGHEPWSDGRITCSVMRGSFLVDNADLEIERQSPSPAAVQTAVTPASGVHEFRMVAQGQWLVTASKNGDVATATIDLDLSEHESVVLDLDAESSPSSPSSRWGKRRAIRTTR